MYPDAVRKHLLGGGALAWGVVPTSVSIREQTVGMLVSLLERLIDHLASQGIDRQLIIDQSLLTPSCGTGSMEPADAEKVFAMTESLSRTMRDKYGFAGVSP